MAEKAQKKELVCSICLKKQLQMKVEERDRDELGDKLEVVLNKGRGRCGNGSRGRNEEKRGSCTTKVLRQNNLHGKLCDRDQDRVGALMTKCWQSMQSRDTNNMNLEKDLEDNP